jgi:hypothetical protein
MTMINHQQMLWLHHLAPNVDVEDQIYYQLDK